MARVAIRKSGNRLWRICLRLLLLVPLCQAVGTNAANASFTYVRPPNCSDEMLSSNWWDEVRCALPSNLWAGKNLDLRLATNQLARESRRGNLAAQGLWGYTMVSYTPLTVRHADREIGAGLDLMENSASNGYIPSMSRLAQLCTDSRVVVQDYNEAFHWYTVAAGMGDAMSQLHLGECYYFGRGMAKNPAKAAENFRLAATGTNYMAMKNYGSLLMDGIGVAQDLQAAKYWFERAATEGGNRRAMNNLAVIYARNFSDSNSMAQAFHWFKQSAELGDPLAAMQLSLFYYNGWGVTQTNLDSYREWRLKAANFGATESQYEMAVACRSGDGVPIDPKEAIRWYTLAAAKNHPAALFDLAEIYGEAKNANPIDLKTAADMMRRAAEGGHRGAQLEYGLECSRGSAGTGTDCAAGRQWLAKSAQSGWGPAEYCLFDFYFHGTSPGPNCPGFPKDLVTAMMWLRKAAGHNDYQAESILADVMLQGTNASSDKVEAERLLRDAATHGYAPAMNDLGVAIMHGNLSDRDPEDGAMWCKLATEHTDDPKLLQMAEANLGQVMSHLTMAQSFDLNLRAGSMKLLPPARQDPLPPGWADNPGYQQEDGVGDH